MAKAPVETIASDFAKSDDDDRTGALFSSFLRSFAIIETVVSSTTPLTLDAICAATGSPKSTVHRVHCTSTGKLLHSFLPARQRRRLPFRTALPKFTDSTVTDPIRIEEELKHIRRHLIATDEGGYLDGMISIAVPEFGLNRRVIGGVAVHARQTSLPLDKAFSYLSDLKQAARDLGAIYRRLG